MDNPVTISNEVVESLASFEDACNEFILLASKFRLHTAQLDTDTLCVADVGTARLHYTLHRAIEDACYCCQQIGSLQNRVIGITE